jgi:hypothetical protein
MGTLADPIIRGNCRERIERLRPEMKPKWGRMTAPQMICHLNDSFRVANGERYASPQTNLLQRTFIKWVAFRTQVRWPQGSPTRPEVEQGLGGTPPGNWDQDRADLLGLIHTFADRQTYGSHPIFGALSREEWLIWGYRHTDHHLRQFGV